MGRSIFVKTEEKEVKNHICCDCDVSSALQRFCQFIDRYEPPQGYSDQVKRECIKMYVNGMGFRGIERVKGVHHTTLITWVKLVGELLLFDLGKQIVKQVLPGCDSNESVP